MNNQAPLIRVGLEITVVIVGIVLFVRARAKERKSHGSLADAKADDLPIVLKSRTPPIAGLIIGAAILAVIGTVFGIGAFALFPHWIMLVLAIPSLGLFFFSAALVRVIFRPRAPEIVTIRSNGISIENGGSISGDYAWRDIIGIGHTRWLTFAGDMLTLYLSPDAALRRAKARGSDWDINLVRLYHLEGYSDWDLRPLGRLIDKYRQICTGLPPLYKY